MTRNSSIKIQINLFEQGGSKEAVYGRDWNLWCSVSNISHERRGSLLMYPQFNGFQKAVCGHVIVGRLPMDHSEIGRKTN